MAFESEEGEGMRRHRPVVIAHMTTNENDAKRSEILKVAVSIHQKRFTKDKLYALPFAMM